MQTSRDARPGARRIALVVALLPGLALFAFVLRFAVDVPFIDQWFLAGPLCDWLDGHGSLGQLWGHHNQHRILFGRVVIFALAALTDWNIRAETMLNVLLAAGILLGLHAWVSSERPGRHPWLVVLFAPFLFSLHGYMNWLQGIQITVFLSVLGFVWSLVLLARRPLGRGRFALAVLAAIVASYSFTSGFLAWPLGLPLLWRQRRALLAWTATGATTTLVHVVDLLHAQEASAGGFDLPSLGALAEYVCVFLGAAVVGPGRVTEAMVVGILGLGTAVALAPRLLGSEHRDASSLVTVALGLYALGVGAMAALARAGLGVEQALASRYTIHGAFLWIAILAGLHLAAARAGRRMQRTLLAVSLAPCLLLLATQSRSWPRALAQHDLLARAKTALLRGEGLTRELLLGVSSDPGHTARMLDRLKRRRLSLYRRAPAAALRPSTVPDPTPLRLEVTAVGEHEILLTARGGQPRNGVAFYVTRVGDRRVRELAHLGALDARGRVELRLAVPEDWSAEPVGFVVEAIGRCVFPERSEEVVWRP